MICPLAPLVIYPKSEILIYYHLGLRAEMGVGLSRMNLCTVGKASAGLAAFLPPRSRVIIGHDHRHNSAQFALIAARAYAAVGHQVTILPGLVPTPFIPAALQCFPGRFQLGIMITASHNPAADNGYKVYGPNGAQIVDSVAKVMAACIDKIDTIQLSEKCDFEDANILKEITSWYKKELREWISLFPKPKSIPKIVYTAMHGVGGAIVTELFRELFSTGKT